MQDPREDGGKGDPVKAPRNIVTNPLKKGKTQTVFFDSQVWEETEKYPEPYHDPGKIEKMNGKPKKVKVRKKKGEEDNEEGPVPFFPAVGKWAKYKGVDKEGVAAHRFGNPYPYFERKLNVKKRKIRNKDGMGFDFRFQEFYFFVQNLLTVIRRCDHQAEKYAIRTR